MFFDTCKPYDIISTITKEKKLTCERVCVSSRVTELVCSWMKTYIRKSSSSSWVLNNTLSCLHTRLINFTYMNLREEFQKSQFIDSEWPRQVNESPGWDGWMASLTRWMWVWVNSRSLQWTGRPGVLRFKGSQRVGHDWVTELNWTELKSIRDIQSPYQLKKTKQNCCTTKLWQRRKDEATLYS